MIIKNCVSRPGRIPVSAREAQKSTPRLLTERASWDIVLDRSGRGFVPKYERKSDVPWKKEIDAICWKL